jgi:CRP-like cAMP-binding protein
MLCPDILGTPEPRATLAQLGKKRNVYKISFFVESTKQLSTTKDALLRCSRRQLYCAGLLEAGHQLRAENTSATTPSAGHRLLRDLILLESLSAPQIDDLVERLELRLLEPGEKLFVQGTTDATLYVVASGILALARQMEALTTETVGCIGAGEYVGEIGLLTGAPHATTATARTYCRIYHLPRDAIAPLLSKTPELASAFEKSAKHGLDILHRQVAKRATGDVDIDSRLLPRIRRFFHFEPA